MMISKYWLSALVTAVVVFVATLVVVFGILLHRKELSYDEATHLTRELMALASTDFEQFAQRFVYPMDVEELRESPAIVTLDKPERILVSRLENHVLIGGLDEKAISDIDGTFFCHGLDVASRYHIRVMYYPRQREWRVMDFRTDGCS